MDLSKVYELGTFEKKLKSIETPVSRKTAAAIAQENKDDGGIGKSITIKERAPRCYR